MDDQNNDTPKVTGLGGIFFFSEDPETTRSWYAENLGMATHDWGATFEGREMDDPEKITATQWSPFKKGSPYFAPSEKEFMINYRVQNLAAMVENLKSKNIEIYSDMEDPDFGRFVHIIDPEGNKIELWEPKKT